MEEEKHPDTLPSAPLSWEDLSNPQCETCKRFWRDGAEFIFGQKVCLECQDKDNS